MRDGFANSKLGPLPSVLLSDDVDHLKPQAEFKESKVSGAAVAGYAEERSYCYLLRIAVDATEQVQLNCTEPGTNWDEKKFF